MEFTSKIKVSTNPFETAQSDDDITLEVVSIDPLNYKVVSETGPTAFQIRLASLLIDKYIRANQRFGNNKLPLNPGMRLYFRVDDILTEE